MTRTIGIAIVCAAAMAAACGGKAVIDSSGAGGSGAGGSAATVTSSSAQSSGSGGGNACGDPVDAANWQACLQADDEVSCLDAGGSWQIVGLAPEPECTCPTGQSSCPCSKSSDCLSSCIAEPTNGLFECEGVAQGNCAPTSITVGCWCFFDSSGGVEGICVD